MQNEKLYQIALSLIPGIGDVNTKHLISYCGSAEAIFKSNKNKLNRIPGIGEKTASLLTNQNVLLKAEKELNEALKENIEILFFTDKRYPEKLKQIQDAPTLLYYKGNADLNTKKIISIVGTRQATNYGKEVVEKIVADLKKYDCLIVSGLAYGIDIFAHKSALKYDLPTVGIMASGLNIIYPSVHKEVAKQMLYQGGLLTEYKLGEKPDAHNFPSRNRIIAGIADAVIVVEAIEKGGALITADIAHSYDKEVFAVPGKLTDKTSSGCNALIQSLKAQIFTSIKDVEVALGWDIDIAKKKPGAPPKYDSEELTVDEKMIVQLLLKNNNQLHIDEISWKSQVNISKLASILLNLELKNIVKPLPGKKFVLN